MKIPNIIERFKYYNGEELFLWIQTIALHPSNQIFQSRFELLLGLLFSIHPNEFKGNKLTRNEFEKFINDFKSDFIKDFPEFSMLEDWKPFNQLKTIPFFYKKKQYYFFYGVLERPYEFLRQFSNLYSQKNNEELNELIIIQSLLETSLEFQTKIIEELLAVDESEINSETIYIPSQQYFDSISPLFKIEDWMLYDLESLPIFKLGDFKNIIDNIYKKYINCDLFKSLHVQFPNGHNYFLIPQVHLEVLYEHGKKLINSSSNKKQLKCLIYQNFILRLQKKCTQFFTIQKRLAQILQKNINRNLAESTDVIFGINSNKIFFFKAVKHNFENELKKDVENTIDEIKKIIEEIKKEEVVGLCYFDKKVITIPVIEMEFWAIVVFESLSLNYKMFLDKSIEKDNIWIINMMDLQGIFEFLDSNLSFISFLKNDREFLEKTKVNYMDYLDRFAYYIENGESYLGAGKYPDWISFDAHYWSDFYNKKLFEKYQDNIFELVEKEYPDTYNYINKRFDNFENIYEVIDEGKLNGGLVIKYNKQIIWITYPINGYNCTDEEVKSYSGLIGPLYAYYISKLKEVFQELFRKNDAEFTTEYCLEIYPASLIKRIDELNDLMPYVSKLSDKNPILVVTERSNISRKIFQK